MPMLQKIGLTAITIKFPLREFPVRYSSERPGRLVRGKGSDLG